MNRKPKSLEERARDLPVPPLPDALWGRIERRLDEPARAVRAPKRRLVLRYALAACLALAAATAAYRFWPKPQAETVTSNTASTLLVQSANDDLDMAIFYYERAIGKLEKAGAEPEGMPPEMAAMYRKKIALLKSSIAECKQALKYNPAHKSVRTALYTSYMDLEQTLTEMHEHENTNSNRDNGI